MAKGDKKKGKGKGKRKKNKNKKKDRPRKRKEISSYLDEFTRWFEGEFLPDYAAHRKPGDQPLPPPPRWAGAPPKAEEAEEAKGGG